MGLRQWWRDFWSEDQREDKAQPCACGALGGNGVYVPNVSHYNTWQQSACIDHEPPVY